METALILPAFLIVFVGIIFFSLVTFAESALNYAVQEGARCASVKTSTCPDAARTQTYARSQYFGPGSPSFVVSKPGCGNSVSATVTLSWNFGVFSPSVPLSAASCFPLN